MFNNKGSGDDRMRIQAVIFDMDGVIFDTERLALKVWMRTAEELGIPDIELLYPSCIGTNYARTQEILYDRYGSSFPQKEFTDRVRKYFKEATYGGLPVKPGAEELLSQLKVQHTPTALASSTASEIVRQELEDADLIGYFDALICGDMVRHSKPDPEIFLKAGEAVNAEPSGCLVIEDSFNGVRACKASGLYTVMVPDIIRPDDEMRELADVILPSLKEVQDFLNLK